MAVLNEVIDQSAGLGGSIERVDLFDADRITRCVLGADVERQVTGLAAVGDQLFTGIEVTLAEAMTFQQIAIAARADGEI